VIAHQNPVLIDEETARIIDEREQRMFCLLKAHLPAAGGTPRRRARAEEVER
jgi:hypothetical protein